MELGFLYNFIFKSENRFFWGYILSSLLIALLFLAFSKSQNNKFSFWNIKEYLWNSSSRLDYQLFIFHRILKVFILPLEASVVFTISRKLVNTFSEIYFINLSSGVLVLLYSIFSFVFDDFLKYIFHRWMHTNRILWQFHQVHHSANSLNPISLDRAHFVESLFSSLRRIISLSISTSVFMCLTGDILQSYHILGVNIFGFLFNLAGSHLRHSHIYFSFGVFEKVFISPAQHQIHHSIAKEHHNKNYGVCLSIWDQIFGSFQPTIKVANLSFGINPNELNHGNSLLDSQWQPIKKVYSMIIKNIRRRDEKTLIIN